MKWLVCYKIKKTQRWEIIENYEVLKDRVYVLNKLMNIDKNNIIVVSFSQSLLETIQ